MKKKIIVLTGLTASGKTKMSIKLAKKIKASIICADSRIVYKNLDIVSAKPTLEEREGIVHHLIDIKEPSEDFSAGDFAALASKIIDEAEENIIICGGTWFYIKSLLDNKALLDCPKNSSLREELEKLSNEKLWKELEKLDYKRAQFVHPNNRDKVIRSIEMCKHLGIPVSEAVREDNLKYEAKWYMPKFSRDEIYSRINKRVDEMIALGLEEEWRINKEKYGNCPIMENTIGYKEFFDLEQGIYKTKEEAIEKIKQHTRNFAKRQMTYFRAQSNIVAISDISDIY